MAGAGTDDDGEDGALEEAVEDVAELDDEPQVDEERLEGDLPVRDEIANGSAGSALG